jgi:quinol monooxygenase YgiN
MTKRREGADAGLVCVIAEWTAPADLIDQTRELICELAVSSLQEPGCLMFDLWEPVDDPGRFVLIEKYSSEVGRAAHREAPHFNELVLDRAVSMGIGRVIRMYTSTPCTSSR